MNLTFTGRHLEVTPSLKNYIEKKLARVKDHFDHIIDAHVILEVEKQTHKAEITINSEGKTFFCEVKTDEMYTSIDKLFDKVERQVRKYKEKITNRKENVAMSQIFKLSEETADNLRRIQRITEILPKPMSNHEACLQMSVNKTPFNIFYADDNTGEKVVMKENDNVYSIIGRENGNWIKSKLELEEQGIKELEKNTIDVDNLEVEEAVDRLLDTNLKFYIYCDKETNKLCIIHLKNDDIALITSTN